MIRVLLFLISALTAHAEIRQVETMDELLHTFEQVDKDTLAIFDVDMVLVQPDNPAFQMPNMKRYGAVAKRIMKEIPQEKVMMFLSLMTTSYKTILLDTRTPQFLQGLRVRGVPTMALTSNLTGSFDGIRDMAAWRVETLRALGIDFVKGAPASEPIIFTDLAPYRGNYSLYRDGMLFVNGTAVSKGDALLSFIAKAKISPQKVLFVDDREENLKSVAQALESKNIPFVGIHYLGAQKYPSEPITEEAFESEWQKLAAKASASE